MKTKLFGGVAVTAVLSFAACGDDDGATGGAGGATTATTTTVGPTTTTGPTTTASTTASTTAMSSSSTGMMGVCPEDPNDPPCVVCAKETCCDQTDPCLDDPECSACLDCV